MQPNRLSKSKIITCIEKQDSGAEVRSERQALTTLTVTAFRVAFVSELKLPCAHLGA